MKFYSVLLFAVCFFLKSYAQSIEDKRPNIVWITCEDMSPQHLGMYGGKVAKTPVLDALAADGVLYMNVFTTAGVCAPSRSALITGLYQTSYGAQHMRAKLSPEIKKALNTNLDSYSAMPPEDVRCFPEYLRQVGYYCTNNSKQDYQFKAPVTVWDESSENASWRNRKDKSQPFFAVFNCVLTHEGQMFPNEKRPLNIDPAKVDVPPYYPDVPLVRKDIAQHLHNIQQMDKWVGEIIAQLKTDGLYDDTYIFFFSDHGDGLPFVKREIYHRGLRVPFIIKFPKSAMAGTIKEELISFIDIAPTILSLAGIPVPQYMHGAPFLGPQQRTTPRQYIFAARDRMDTELDRVRTVSDGRFQYLRNYMPELPYYMNIDYRKRLKSMQEILRLKEAGKLKGHEKDWFKSHKPIEELYDTWNDPYEFHNLAEDSIYKNKLEELRAAHESWLRLYGDWGALPELEMVNKMWKGASTPPKTAAPKIEVRNGVLYITAPTPGSSIGYKLSLDEKSWHVYSGPVKLPPSDYVYAVAHRIGYDQSDRVTFKLK